VVGNVALGGLAFLRGRGDGTFDTAVPIDGASYGSAWSGDLNGDGHLDLVETWVLTVFLGAGDGTFRMGPATSLNPVVSAQLVDLNGDGRLDFVGTDWNSENVYVALGNGDGTFQPEMRFAIADPSGTAEAAWISVADVNNDGWPDLVVGNYYDGNVSIFLNSCHLVP
jgi:hypothetical protein